MTKGRKTNKRLDARRLDYDKMVQGSSKKSYIGKSGRPGYHRPGSNSK